MNDKKIISERLDKFSKTIIQPISRIPNNSQEFFRISKFTCFNTIPLSYFNPQNSLPFKYKKNPATFYIHKLKSKRRKPFKILNSRDTRLRYIRCGAYVGSQDQRSVKCSLYGIKHWEFIKPGINCICNWLPIVPSPLHKQFQYNTAIKKILPLINIVSRFESFSYDYVPFI